jgi:Flp pilus assembly protein TadG
MKSIMSLRRLATDDQGAYAALYSITLVLFIAFGAVVVDLNSARWDRRVDRLGADSAALGGAHFLVPGETIDAHNACHAAWAYLDQNIPGLTQPGSDPCTPFDNYTDVTAATCPTDPVPGTTTTAGNFTVTITWPVRDDSPLMTNPDLRPGNVKQDPDDVFDGTKAQRCNRIGVQVARARSFILGPVMGSASGVNTLVHSVARGSSGQPPKDPAALVVLEQHRCSVLTTSGQGGVTVQGYVEPDGTKHQGIIAVDSDGNDSGNVCPNNRPWVVDPKFDAAASSSHVCASGPGPDGPPYPGPTPPACNGNGTIKSFAMKPGNNPTQAYDPSLSLDTLAPKPTGVAEPLTAKPVMSRYGCRLPADPNLTDECHSPNYVDQMLQTLGQSTPLPYPGAQAPYNAQAFTTLSDGSVIPGSTTVFSCKPTTPLYITPGNYFVNCPDPKKTQAGFNVTTPVVFGGGTVVFAGSVEASVSGCLAVNFPLSLPQGSILATCPTSVGSGKDATTAPFAPATDAIVYLRDGASWPERLIKGAKAQIFMPRTFVNIQDGFVTLGAGDGTLLWTMPRAEDCAADDDECRYARFHKLVLWSEGSDTHQIGGQAALYLVGVLFTPRAPFTFNGQAGYQSANAQFWARTLELAGQGGLVMQVDPSVAVPTDGPRTLLIR